jgi:hypothetical protein
MLRSSQPLAGITSQTSLQDEILINACRLSVLATQTRQISQDG